MGNGYKILNERYNTYIGFAYNIRAQEVDAVEFVMRRREGATCGLTNIGRVALGRVGLSVFIDGQPV